MNVSDTSCDFRVVCQYICAASEVQIGSTAISLGLDR